MPVIPNGKGLIMYSDVKMDVFVGTYGVVRYEVGIYTTNKPVAVFRQPAYTAPPGFRM
jgi:hypothetical protein